MYIIPKIQFVSHFAVETLLKNGCETDGTRIICKYHVGNGVTSRLIIFIKDGLLVDPQTTRGEVRVFKKRFIKVVTPNKTFQFSVHNREFKG